MTAIQLAFEFWRKKYLTAKRRTTIAETALKIAVRQYCSRVECESEVKTLQGWIDTARLEYETKVKQ